MNELTIVMYHYVRDPIRSRYPRIKARTLSEFRQQLDFIAANYTVVTAEEVMAATTGEANLPPRPIWLTFDDGYLDHYLNVFPLLHERQWQGSFFPPGRAIVEGSLLDVNKVHLILATEPNTMLIVDELKRLIAEHARDEGLEPFDNYWRELAVASRFDSPETIFIKRLLQHRLPQRVRSQFIDHLLLKFMTVDAAALAAELYMSVDQLRTMHRCGMYIGSHGYDHCWLDRVPPDRQIVEIDSSLGFLRTLGAPTERWVMCYPYGGYDNSLVSRLKERGCTVGLTTRVCIADLGADLPLTLPRIDTNDLPPAPQSLIAA